MQKKVKPGSQSQSKTAKKLIYNTPILRIFGNIRELTLTSQKAGSADNPGMETNMTI